MTDIVVCTNDSVLDHKRGYGVPIDSEYYWAMKRRPKDLRVGDRIYFVTNGRVQGSFEVKDFYDDPIWRGDSWLAAPISVTVKSFRGFRYRWWS